MTSYSSERRNASILSKQSAYSSYSEEVTDAHNAQEPTSQESFAQPSGAKTCNEAVRIADSASDLSELWKLSAYKQLEGWRRSGP